MHANLFGNGIGMGATAFEIGLEIPELADINLQADGSPGDFPTVQLLNNDGSPLNSHVLTGYSDADADVVGDVRVGDWEYLSDGNIVIVAESRQQSDLVDRFGGTAGGNHAAFRIVRPDGSEVKGLTLVSDAPVANSIWGGVGVVRGGFAVRFDQGGARVRLFRNDGTPITENLNMASLTGNSAIGEGGRGDSTGFHGNGADAYVMANTGLDQADQVRKAWITVLNADGTLRYSRAVSDDVPLSSSDRVDAGIDSSGRAIAVYDDAAGTANNVRLVRGRLFNADGTPGGSTFYVSEVETPSSVTFEASGPRVALRNGRVAIIWETANNPTTTSRVVAGRLYRITTPDTPQDNGLNPASSTFYVNTGDTINNGSTESLGVAIANNGNVIVAWEDDGDALTDLEAVWTMYNSAGQPITASRTITTLTGPDTITSSFLSFFRSDSTPIAGRTAWGPKMHANLFGNGIGMGATAFEIGLEIP
ncbi:MAG TPA: hypothetical protein VNM37_28630, partial [Candidatus Dormibacteraeota bacterium]|nr:hypothetical protein [Candidatus Dormibacteraeota bacterium]